MLQVAKRVARLVRNQALPGMQKYCCSAPSYPQEHRETLHEPDGHGGSISRPGYAAFTSILAAGSTPPVLSHAAESHAALAGVKEPRGKVHMSIYSASEWHHTAFFTLHTLFPPDSSHAATAVLD